MDDIIWTILLIMYDYLFLFSLVTIDPQLQQLKKGGKIAIACSWRGHQAERALAFCSLETHKKCSSPLQRALVGVILDNPNKRPLEVDKTGRVLLVGKMKNVKFREPKCFAQGHTAGQNQGFKSRSFDSKASVHFSSHCFSVEQGCKFNDKSKLPLYWAIKSHCPLPKLLL